MRQQVASLVAMGLLAAMLATVSVFELKSGSVRSLLWHGRTIERDQEPVHFWIAWCLWAAVALLGLGMTAWKGGLAIQHPDPTPATGRDLLGVALLPAMVICGLLFLRLHQLWRRGPPWNGALRRERELDKLIRSLADDQGPVYDDETREASLEMLLKYGDLEFLEQVAAHLATQAPPRSLRRALDELDPPVDDDEDAPAP